MIKGAGGGDGALFTQVPLPILHIYDTQYYLYFMD